MIRFKSRPAAILVAAALMAATAVQAGQIKSNLQIEAGQTFELGGGQEGGFVVTGKNTGPVAVIVLAKREGAAPQVRGTVEPGGAVDARFGGGEMAMLRNTSGRETARLKLTVNGDTSGLGMTYSANP